MNLSGKNISWFRGLITRFTFPRRKNFDSLGSPEGGIIPRHVFINFEKIYPQKGKAPWSHSGLVDGLSNFIKFNDSSFKFPGTISISVCVGVLKACTILR